MTTPINQNTPLHLEPKLIVENELSDRVLPPQPDTLKSYDPQPHTATWKEWIVEKLMSLWGWFLYVLNFFIGRDQARIYEYQATMNEFCINYLKLDLYLPESIDDIKKRFSELDPFLQNRIKEEIQKLLEHAHSEKTVEDILNNDLLYEAKIPEINDETTTFVFSEACMSVRYNPIRKKDDS